MNKKLFFKEIEDRLRDFSSDEKDKIIEYYDELINDYVDEGYSEEEAISRLGDINTIINTLKADLVIQRSSNKKTNSLKNFIIILSICTSPVLIPIGITFFVVFIVLAVSLLVMFLSFAVGSISTVVAALVTTIGMIVEGADAGVILLMLGSSLFVGAILGIFAVGVYKISVSILNSINKMFSKSIKKKSNKEIRENV